MAGVAAVLAKRQFFDDSGNPLTGGLVDVYLAGTTTRSNTWQDRDQTTLNTNPVVLDAAGWGTFYLDSSVDYKFVIKTSAGVTLKTEDNIVGAYGSAAAVRFTPSGAGAVTRDMQTKVRDSVWIHAADFGAVADGVTNNATAFNSMLASRGTGKLLNIVLDEGTYLFPRTANGSFTGSGTVVVPTDVKFWGKGKGKTIIAEGQTTATYAGNLFWLNSGVSAEFNDLTMQGPLTQPTSGSSAPALIGIHWQDNANTRTVRLNNVSFTGWFVVNVQKSTGADAAGTVVLECKNSSFRPYQTCISFFAVDNIDAEVRCFDCNFERGGIPSTDPGYPFNHSMYIHPHVNLHFERCKWPEVNGNKYALHHFSGAGKTSTYAKFAKFIDCDFRLTSGTPGAIFEQSDVIPLMFVRCKFGGDANASIVKPVGTTFIDCGDENNPCELQVNDSVGGGALKIVGGTWKQRTSSLGNVHNYPGTWRVRGATVICDTNNAISWISVGSTATGLHLENVEFRSTLTGGNRGTSPIIVQGSSATIEIIGGSISGIYGLTSQSGLFTQFSSFSGTVKINNVDFSRLDGATSQAISVLANTMAAYSLTSQGCIHGSAPMNIAAAANVQLIEGSRGINPTSVASAGTINPTYQYDTYIVTGNVAINTITMNNLAASQKGYTGTIRLIAAAGSAWSTGGAGNIRARTAAARAVNEVVTLSYDPVNAIWCE